MTTATREDGVEGGQRRGWMMMSKWKLFTQQVVTHYIILLYEEGD
jgi:hypothetical protein